jgi:hypothetical protein
LIYQVSFYLHKVAGNRRSHVPFPDCHVEVNACPQDFGAGLVVGLDLIESQRRIVKHSKLKISARSKGMPLPIAFQGIGDSWRKTKGASVAKRTSRKATVMTVSIMSSPK